MKKINIYRIIFTAFVLSTFAACNEQLDLPSDGRITMDEVFNDYNRTRGYLNSCYGYCPAPYMDRASLTDEAEDADDITANSRYSNWYEGNVTAINFGSNSTDGNPWGHLYEGIRKCNVFIENMKTATVYASEEVKAGWVAQAQTLRALYYLQLIKRYGGVPIIDKPFEVGADFSAVARSTFAEVVDFIVKDCDEALAVPNTQDGFHWAVYDNQFGIMTRAAAYAIKSEAVTYAASELWSDGTYTWEEATAVNAEALAQCLANDYKLFDVEPAPDIAQNPYALYFITSSNDQRSVDKETILQIGGQMQVWKYAGLPTNAGMEKAGPCPTQDLVDSYEMANGEMPITGYSDADHLQPVINEASGYDPTNPYLGRDPRFYASIYYNGAPRNLGSTVVIRNDRYDLDLTSSTNQLDVVPLEEGGYELTTLGGDPNVMITALTEGLNNPPSVVLKFEYTSSAEVAPQFYFGPALAEPRSIKPAAIPKAEEWSTYAVDMTDAAVSFGWGNAGDNLRFDVGVNQDVKFKVKNIRIEVVSGIEIRNLDLTSNANQLGITALTEGYEMVTQGGDPWVMTTGLEEDLGDAPSVALAFEYTSTQDVNPQFFFGPALAEARSIKPSTIPASSEWSTYSVDITGPIASFNWGNAGDNLRFDVGTNSGVTFKIKNIRIEIKEGADLIDVKTYVGGDEEISQINRKYTRTGYYLRKFNNFKSGESNNADGAIRLFRLAELYLNFAESAYQSNGPDAVVSAGGLSMSARDAVNAVRQRAGMPDLPAGLTTEQFEKRYRNERRVELAFEEHRFFDVRRWKILDETDKFVTGMKITMDGEDLTYQRFKFENRQCISDKYFMYPIPQDEVDKMIEIAGQNWQNPGWMDAAGN